MIANFNWADWFIVVVMTASAVIGLFRGLIREAWSLLSWVVAAICTVRFATPLAHYFESFIQTPSIRVLCAGAIILVLVLIVGGLLGMLLGQVVSKTGLSGTDRLLGMVFGIGRGVLLMGVIIMVAKLAHMDGDPWWSQSQLLPYFMPMVAWLQVFLPNQIASLSKLVAGKGS